MYRAARVPNGIGLFVLLIVCSDPIVAQPAKKVLTFADEGIWRTASQPVMSPDGSVTAYSVWPVEGDGESVVRHIATGKEFRFPRGSGASTADPKFTPDAKWVMLPLTPTKAEIEKAKTAKVKPEDMPQPTLVVVDVATGKVIDKFPQSGAFAVAGEGAGFVIYRKPAKVEPGKDDAKMPTPPIAFKGKLPAAPGATPPTTGKTFGSDLLIRDVAAKTERTISDVAEFSLTRDRKLLVYTVNSKAEERNGVFALNPKTGHGEAIRMGPGRFSGLTWDEKQSKLAFLYDDSTVPDPKVAPPPRLKGVSLGTVAAPPTTPPPPARYRVMVWDRNAKPPAGTAIRVPIGATGGFGSLVPVVIAANPPTVTPADEVLGPNSPGFRDGWVLSGGTLAFSVDGTKLFVNTAPKRDRASTPAVTRPDDFQLDLWHWKDDRLQPMQKLQAAADQAKTYVGVVHLDNKLFRQLADEELTVGRTLPSSDWAVGSDDRKYRGETGYGLPLTDYAAVNVRTGERKLILPRFGGYNTPEPNIAPTGKHLAGFDGKDWFTVSIPDGKKTNLTANLKVAFHNEEDDHPGSPPPTGTPQWTADGKFLLVNDRYDIWKLAADGSSHENLTRIGRERGIRFTLIRVPVQDEYELFRGFDLSKPQLLTATHLQTRNHGFYRLEPGAAPKLLVMGACRYGIPTKAKDADVYLVTVQSFTRPPDYFATTDFHELKQVTDTNPRVKDFNWGSAELVNYTSIDGVKLSGVLVKPENFDPSKKYPMVVYIYERLTDTIHTFRPPVVRGGQVINPTFYASNGYLVLMPDIAYKVGAPGQSAIKCVLPSIQAVVEKGFVDEKAIGINGQSWGGYQIAYMVTQTDRFKAAVAGAPVSNMVSAYDGIRWGTGLTRQFQYEWTQSRIGATLWQAPMKYIENSPVFMADRVKTPLLMIHNDQDDAVPWYQGIEYYLALRRLGKECYLLNYNGQPHNLTNRAAARDFAARMFQFFEHHLKGKPEPAWMAKGVPYLDREKDKEEIRKLLGQAPK